MDLQSEKKESQMTYSPNGKISQIQQHPIIHPIPIHPILIIIIHQINALTIIIMYQINALTIIYQINALTIKERN